MNNYSLCFCIGFSFSSSSLFPRFASFIPAHTVSLVFAPVRVNGWLNTFFQHFAWSPHDTASLLHRTHFSRTTWIFPRAVLRWFCFFGKALSHSMHGCSAHCCGPFLYPSSNVLRMFVWQRPGFSPIRRDNARFVECVSCARLMVRTVCVVMYF